MVRLAVFSDTHGIIAPACTAIRAYGPDMVIHLGDYVRDALSLQEVFPALDIRYVRGNCDVGMKATEDLLLELEGVKIFATHGHAYSVKWQLDTLGNKAYFEGARLCLFGHTHQKLYLRYQSLELLNPGSAGAGEEASFALITLEKGTTACKIIHIGEGNPR